MPSSDLSESIVLAEWAEKECVHLDLISSWETLLSVYDVLQFTGPDNDEQRLTEFKTVIHETNKFLTRMRSGLAKTATIEDAIAFLMSHVNTTDMNTVRSRPTIAYNKLKQRWIANSILTLENAQEMLAEREAEEGERDD